MKTRAESTDTLAKVCVQYVGIQKNDTVRQCTHQNKSLVCSHIDQGVTAMRQLPGNEVAETSERLITCHCTAAAALSKVVLKQCHCAYACKAAISHDCATAHTCQCAGIMYLQHTGMPHCIINQVLLELTHAVSQRRCTRAKFWVMMLP